MDSTCPCDFPPDCDGTGLITCEGCGGDLCACKCGGEITCPGCYACQPEEAPES